MLTETVSSAAAPREWLRDLDLAAWLGVGVSTLRQWRHRRVGPPFVHLGRCVRYRRVEVERWLAERAAVEGR